MRVVVNYLRSSTAAGEIVAGIEAAGGQAMAVQADVREAAAVESMVGHVRAAWGGIDVLVHNALIPYAVKSFQDMTWEELGGKLDAEMHAAFAVTKAVLPAMTEQGWGRIIYIGTGLSHAAPGPHDRAGHRQGRTGAVRPLPRPGTGPQGITVNVVAPGPVEDTRMAHMTDVFDDAHKQRQVAATPWAAWHTRTTSPRRSPST